MNSTDIHVIFLYEYKLGNTCSELVETNPIISIRELATRMKVVHTTILRHLSEIGKMKKMDKWIPKRLISEMVQIKKQKHGINRQNDIESLPELYSNIIHSLFPS
ncbi:SETMR methyltransferase, partial [Acromyrmex insinuator]